MDSQCFQYVVQKSVVKGTLGGKKERRRRKEMKKENADSEKLWSSGL